jgi:hypothetical protein
VVIRFGISEISHNIGKAVDKIRGNEREVIGEVKQPRMNNDFGKGNHNEREMKELDITKGTSEWEGWGTALKPANEPICVARKPISEKTITANVLKWGTGGINIDGCRVGTETISIHNAPKGTFAGGEPDRGSDTNSYRESEGRFPANIILDEEAGRVLDEQSGIGKSTKSIWNGFSGDGSLDGWKRKAHINKIEGGYNDKGGASRFFYCPKVSKKERNAGCDELEEKQQDLSRKEGNPGGDNPRNRGVNKVKNNHPTVKPISLMAYLCRLVTPPNGIVLDPFMGSGSTGCAAVQEGFRFVGMELDEDYFEIATKRINHYEK